VLNAGRKYLGTEDLAGKVFVTSGLGGMSGAQPKAAVIAGCIGVVAEVGLKASSAFFLLYSFSASSSSSSIPSFMFFISFLLNASRVQISHQIIFY